ncbi:vWA domain-containing protein [Pseudohoeflea coraliihabitans]|uniref:VWA domain-containing protein n=1 Tax=Pseudohoeflea coraliihabitans TaxID=2860393 RepID=A0ABS6WRN7_9HYPH|nr:vWA domain-containing protein [Pseudohoeflea sp. DP4N28-3]MBW3098626.1 VWA domain-containing protein [Pseudohoeflea sp. DP4N28-3]
MFAAVLVPVCFAAGSVLLDFSNVMTVKARTQNAADAAALAVAARLSVGDLINSSKAEKEAEAYFNGEISNELAQYSSFAATPVATVGKVTRDGQDVWEVNVKVEGSIGVTPLASIFDAATMDFVVNADTESALPVQHAFSMALVLDVSGSMDWYGQYSWSPSNGQPKKIEALKTAVSNLMSQIDTADPDAKYSRTGAITYNSGVVDYRLMSWGTKQVTKFAEKLTASGGTSSTQSFYLAYAAVNALIEDSTHINKNGLTPEKIMVFMTDGDNNNAVDDVYTLAYCTAAKAAGITIYTVAFMAPDKGQSLLSSCATDSEHYFEAETADDLIDAFERIGQHSEQILARLTK